MNKNHSFTIALLPWGNVIEDYLDSINISLDQFCTDMTGGWLFGYIEALKLANIQTVLICISSQVTVTTHRLHQPTGATVCILPASKAYLAIRRRMVYAYGWTVKETFGEVSPIKTRLFEFLRQLSPYLATPLRRLAQELKQMGCQAILCQEYEYPRFDHCVLLGKYLNIPVFATFQGGDFQTWKIEQQIRPLTMKEGTGFIIPSQTEIKRVKSVYRVSDAKIAKIFNPLDLNLWKSGNREQTRLTLGIPLDAIVVICHGRIERYRKGLDVLLDAWQKISQNRPESHLKLLLVGTGSDAAWLKTAIAEIPLNNIIWIDEYVLDRAVMADYLSCADIYVLSSRHEGFPVAPLEAMAYQLPIVATDAPGVADILPDGEASGGIIVPRENSTALEQGLMKLIDDLVLRQQLGKLGRKRLETYFSLEAVGQQLRQILIKEKS